MRMSMPTSAGLAILFGAIAVTTVRAQAPQSATQARQQTHVRTEVVATSNTSTRKAKRRTKAAAPATVQAAPPHTVWTGPDPTKGPGIERLRQLQREGRCVIDEGYGRFTYCSDR